MVNNSVKHYELDVELLLIEGSEPTIDIVLELLLRHRNVVFLDPVREQDWSFECLVAVHGWEPLSSNLVDFLVAPVLLLVENKSILK